MPPKHADCMYCGKLFQVGWVLNKHRKQCMPLSADTAHEAAEILHEVRDADADRSYDIRLPETLSIKAHKHKWRLSPKVIDIIKFLGATSRGLPMPQGNVNTMLEYVKNLQGGGANNLPKCSKTAWRLLNTVSYVQI